MIRPIDIQIGDDYKYGLLAFLFDRPDFLRDIESIRKNLLNLHSFIKYDEVENYLKELGIKVKLKGKPMDDLIVRQDDGLTERVIFTDAEFVNTIDWLKKKYKKNQCYEMAIAYAILSGVVKDSEFTTTVYVQFLDQNVLKNFMLDGHFQISLVILPETKITEIKKMFNGEVRHFLKSIEFPKPDKFSNIRRDRKWYWLRQEMIWDKIYEYVKTNYKRKIEKSSIRSAIMYYEKQLKLPLYSINPLA